MPHLLLLPLLSLTLVRSFEYFVHSNICVCFHDVLSLPIDLSATTSIYIPSTGQYSARTWPLRYSGDTENLEARNAPIQANQQLGLLVGNWILRYKLLNSDGSLPAPREAMTLDGRLYQDDPQFREYLTRSGTQRNAQPKGSDVIAYFGDKGLAGVLTDLQNPSKFHFDDGRPWRPWESKPPVPKLPVNVGDLNYFTAVLDYFCSLPTTAQGQQTVLSRERSEVKKLFQFAEKIKEARIAAYNERQKVAAHSKEQEGTRK
ncbi:hypothetical protein C8R42DRAFT_647190 [Lentinula raphanica]|nr:hypothetical protein C8R42DRAFT_647190 [Lentinula raphanica]